MGRGQTQSASVSQVSEEVRAEGELWPLDQPFLFSSQGPPWIASATQSSSIRYVGETGETDLWFHFPLLSHFLGLWKTKTNSKRRRRNRDRWQEAPLPSHWCAYIYIYKYIKLKTEYVWSLSYYTHLLTISFNDPSSHPEPSVFHLSMIEGRVGKLELYTDHNDNRFKHPKHFQVQPSYLPKCHSFQLHCDWHSITWRFVSQGLSIGCGTPTDLPRNGQLQATSSWKFWTNRIFTAKVLEAAG